MSSGNGVAGTGIAATPKTVGGKSVTQKEFKRAIAEAVREAGRCRPRDIAVKLGEEWQSPAKQKVVAQTMLNMVTGHELAREARGMYRLASNYDDRKERWEFEAVVMNILRSLGGMARTSEILYYLGVPTRGFGKRIDRQPSDDPSYVALMRYFRKTDKKIVNYYTPGVWGLPYSEIATLPLPGRWQEHLIVNNWYDYTPRPLRTRERAHIPYDVARKQFARTGEAFNEARTNVGVGIAQVVKDPDIERALQVIAARLPGNNRIYDEVRGTAMNQAKAEGREEDKAYISKLTDRERAKRLVQHILAAFEDGDALVHRLAPVELYLAYAKCFNVWPAGLARGILFCNPPPVHIPSWETGEAFLEWAEQDREEAERLLLGEIDEADLHEQLTRDRKTA